MTNRDHQMFRYRVHYHKQRNLLLHSSADTDQICCYHRSLCFATWAVQLSCEPWSHLLRCSMCCQSVPSRIRSQNCQHNSSNRPFHTEVDTVSSSLVANYFDLNHFHRFHLPIILASFCLTVSLLRLCVKSIGKIKELKDTFSPFLILLYCAI